MRILHDIIQNINMNILNRRYYHLIVQRLTTRPIYQVYIHYQDHDKKINANQIKNKVSYMDPKGLTQASPTNQHYIAKLRKSAQEQVQKKLFESYKEKILSGKIDQEAVVEPDPLWGQNQKPIHYYKNLSNTQVSLVSHSILKDVEQCQIQIVKEFLQSGNRITEISQVKDINDLAELAAYYRTNNILDRTKYYQIQQQIGKKFHLLTNRSLILLKYAFVTSPKQCTPEFNKIINDLLLQSLPNLTANQLVHLMFFNRYDNFRFHKDNLQIPVLQRLTQLFKDFTQEQKIDFLFLYVESRKPTIRPESHNRHYNQIRNRTHQIIKYLDFGADLSQLSQLSVLRLAYSLVRAKTCVTEHITDSIVDYVQANIQNISPKSLVLFFIYLTKIQANKSIQNIELFKQLKQKVIASWPQYTSINKLRALDAMYTLNLFNETAQKLYTQTPIQADSSLLGYFCRLQMMNSTGRQWQVIHRLADLDYLPLPHYQDYKRFYNYVSVTAPDWDLDFYTKKLQNTQIFYNALRFESQSIDKKIYKQIRQFQKFSELKKSLPQQFHMGVAVKNIQFVEFALPKYRISIDVINDVQKIRGTQEIKGSYQIKIKSLECLGWKHLYVFESDIKNLSPLQFFDYLYSICQPHFEQQLTLIASYQQYQSYKIDKLRLQQLLNYFKMRQYQQYMNQKQKLKEGEVISVDLEEVLKKRSQLAQTAKVKQNTNQMQQVTREQMLQIEGRLR